MHPLARNFPLRSAALLLLVWGAVIALLAYLLLQSRQALEREAAQRASNAAHALADRFDALFIQTRQWAEELSRLVPAEELQREAAPTDARLGEIGLWVDDLMRRNPQIATIGFLDLEGRSYRHRGGSGLSLAQTDYWRHLVAQGSAGRGRLVVSVPHVLGATGRLGIVHAYGLYASDGSLAGAVVIGLHLEELEQRLAGLRGGGHGVALLLDEGQRLLVREPAAALTSEPQTTDAPGPLPGTAFRLSPMDGLQRLVADVRLRHAPYTARVALAEVDYLASWRIYRSNVLLAGAALTVAAGLLLWLLVRGARTQRELALTEDLLARTLELLPSACVHASGHPPQLLHANRSARQQLGLSDDARPLLSSLFDDLPAAHDMLARHGQTAEGHAQDLRLRRANGEPFWAAVQLRARPGGEDVLLSFIDIEARRRVEDELRRQSGTDALTGLVNRHAFQVQAAELMKQCRRKGDGLAVMMIDLDHFKAINDRFGHPGGDAVLKAVAQRLQGQRRGGDVVARLGGEEFAVLLPGTPPAAAEAAARRLLQHLRAPAIELSAGIALQVTASIGITAWLTDEDDIDWALARADAALYRAKALGRDRFEVES